MLVVSIGVTGVVYAQKFQKGAEAYVAGDYPTVAGGYAGALKLWKELAEQGHSKAQFNLGLMYDKGLGVLQDTLVTHMWFRIAAANGNEVAVKNRGNAASTLSSSDRVKAQQMAKRCMESNYRNCD